MKRIAAVAIGLSLGGASISYADEPSFADLLTRAHAQVAAGHQWTPAGDNVTETLEMLVRKLPDATLPQLKEFDALLRHAQASIEPAPSGSSDEHAATEAPPATAESGKPSLADGATASDGRHEGAPEKDQAPTIEHAATGDAPVGAASVDAAPGPAQSANSATTSATTASVPSGGAPPDAGAVAGGSVSNRPSDTTPSESGSAEKAALDSGATASVTPPHPVPAAGSGPSPANDAEAPPPAAHAPDAAAAENLARGEAADQRGDVSAARRYYAAAAKGGSAAAARALGRLYDPAFLERNTVGGIDPDIATARSWYERAIALGDQQATPLLKTLAAR